MRPDDRLILIGHAASLAANSAEAGDYLKAEQWARTTLIHAWAFAELSTQDRVFEIHHFTDAARQVSACCETVKTSLLATPESGASEKRSGLTRCKSLLASAGLAVGLNEPV